MPSLLRAAAIVTAILLLTAGGVLGYVAVIALRRGEGVFMPAGCVAVALLVGGVVLLRSAVG
jgi:hypothetical protein